MLSHPQRHALEIRLQVLDALESLATADPNGEYVVQLSDFVVNGTPGAVRAQLAVLESDGITRFIIPIDVTDAGFWESPIRVTNIDIEKLHSAQLSVREELGRTKPQPSSDDISETSHDSDRDSDSAARSPILTSAEVAAYLGIAAVIGLIIGLAGPVTAWHALNTGLAQVLAAVGILIVPLMIARLYRSIKGKQVTWQRSITLLGFGAVCCCTAIVLSSVVGLPGQSGSRLASGGVAQVKFIEPQPGQQVPQCPMIALAGTIPRGMSLWDNGGAQCHLWYELLLVW